MLTCIKGPAVSEWVKSISTYLNTLEEQYNILKVWIAFVQIFRKKFGIESEGLPKETPVVTSKGDDHQSQFARLLTAIKKAITWEQQNSPTPMPMLLPPQPAVETAKTEETQKDKKNALVTAIKNCIKKAKYMVKKKQLRGELQYYNLEPMPREEDPLKPFHQLTSEQQASVTETYLTGKMEPHRTFIKAALLCLHRSNDVFMSAQKSMTLHVYLYSTMKRTKTITLLDLGATENFMNLDYAKYL